MTTTVAPTKLRSVDPVGYGHVEFPPLRPTEQWAPPAIRITETGAPEVNTTGLDEVRDMLWDAISDPYLTAGSFAYREAARARYAQRYSMALADPRAIEMICAQGPIIEVGAGSGWWARLIQTAGGEITATDITGGQRPGHRESVPWTYVDVMDASDAALSHPDCALMMVWPDADTAARATQAYGGDRLVYVGEPIEPDTPFGAALAKEWRRSDGHHLPRWEMAKDVLIVYERA